MIIIGHRAIEYNAFKKIENIENIADSRADEIVWFYSNINESYNLAKYCGKNNIAYGVFVDSLRDVIIFANLMAKFIIIKEKNLVENAQKIANEYFFDSKILYVINDEGSIENMAMLGVDGVIFNDILK